MFGLLVLLAVGLGGLSIAGLVHFYNHPLVGKKDKTWTWEDLGFSKETVRQIQEAGKNGVKLENPPDELVDKTNKAILRETEKRKKKENP